MDIATKTASLARRIVPLLGALILVALLAFPAPALAQNYNPNAIPDESSMQGEGESRPGDADGDGCDNNEYGNSVLGTGSSENPCDDPEQAGEEERVDGDDQNPEELGAPADEGCSVLGIDLCATAKAAARQILTVSWEWMGNTLDKVAEAVMDAAFDLPPLGENGGIVGKYNEMVDLVKPGLIVGVLVLGILMMVQSANYNSQYAALYGLPKIGFVALCLAFFPQFMEMVSGLSSGIAENLGEGSGPSGIGGALKSIMEKAYEVPGADAVFTVSPQLGVIIGALLMIPILVMLIFILMVSVIKNVLFGVLVVTGPLALIVYPLPGLSGITGAWFRAVTACFVLPLLFSVELAVGSWLVDAPEVLGAGDSAVMAAFLLIVLLFVMWKTPFKVLEWAFQGTYSPGSGMLSSIAKSMVKKSAIKGIEKGIGSAIGAFGSGKKGSDGHGKGKPQAPGSGDRKRPGSSGAGKSVMNGRGAATGSASGSAGGTGGAAAEQDFDPARDEHYGPPAGETPGVRPSADADPAEVARDELDVGAAEGRAAGQSYAGAGAGAAAGAAQPGADDSRTAAAGVTGAGSATDAARATGAADAAEADKGAFPTGAQIAGTVPTPAALEVGEAQAGALGQTAHSLSQAGDVSLPEHRDAAGTAGQAAEAARNRADAASQGDHAAAQKFGEQAAARFGALEQQHKDLATQYGNAGNAALADVHSGAASAAGQAASEARQQASRSGQAQQATMAAFFATQGGASRSQGGAPDVPTDGIAGGSAGSNGAGSAPPAFADTMRAAGVGVGNANAALGAADQSALALNSRSSGSAHPDLPSGTGGRVAGSRADAARALQDAHSAVSSGNFGQAGRAFESAAGSFYAVSNMSGMAADAAEASGHHDVARVHRQAQTANARAGHEARAGAQRVRSAVSPPTRPSNGARPDARASKSGGRSAIKISTVADVRRQVAAMGPGGSGLRGDNNAFNGNPYDNIRAAEARDGAGTGK